MSLGFQGFDEVREYFGEKVFATIIPRNIKLSEAPSHGVPVRIYAPMSKGAIAYDELAKEVATRG